MNSPDQQVVHIFSSSNYSSYKIVVLEGYLTRRLYYCLGGYENYGWIVILYQFRITECIRSATYPQSIGVQFLVSKY